MLSESVVFDPPSWEPRVPDDVIDPPTASDDVAVVLTSPVDPTYATPCDSDVSRRDDPNVDDAVEKRPLRSPSVVDVELYPATDVNGKTCPANVDVDTVDTKPFDPMNE